MKDEFLRRLPATATEERQMVEQAFGIPRTVAEKKAAILSDARLKDEAKAADIKAMARAAPLQHLRQIRQRAANMTADVQNARLAMAPKRDKDGEADRREIRDAVIRELPAEHRLRRMLENPTIAEAFLLAPDPVVSGLSDEQFETVRQTYTEKKFGDKLRAVEKREEVIETLDAAIRVATSQFQRETGIAENEIES
jgi:hypothetical protein